MKGGLAIFVKTPGVSPLKTRLAAGIGAASESWYCMAAQAVKSVALDAQTKIGINAYWAVAEMSALQHELWQSLPRLAQAEIGTEELGERMGRVMRMLIRQHGFGLLLGADAPQICIDDIQAAAEFLDNESPRLVLGPARDGGFWCVGGNFKFPMALWQSVKYSQANTYEEFLTAFSPFAEVYTLKTLSDVDEASDLILCNEEIKLLKNPTHEQRVLLESFGPLEIPA